MSRTSKSSARQSAALVVVCSLALAGCGGGGGADPAAVAGAAAPSTAPVAASEAPKVAARVFTEIQAPAGFAWSTVSDVLQARVTVRRADGSAAAVRLVISNFIDVDPTGSGAPMDPMSTDVIASALARPAGASGALVDFGQLRLPAATTHVLIEAFDMDGGGRLGWRKTTPAELAAGQLVLTI
jgi:hypothetical protein